MTAAYAQREENGAQLIIIGADPVTEFLKGTDVLDEKGRIREKLSGFRPKEILRQKMKEQKNS